MIWRPLETTNRIMSNRKTYLVKLKGATSQNAWLQWSECRSCMALKHYGSALRPPPPPKIIWLQLLYRNQTRHYLGSLWCRLCNEILEIWDRALPVSFSMIWSRASSNYNLSCRWFPMPDPSKSLAASIYRMLLQSQRVMYKSSWTQVNLIISSHSRYRLSNHMQPSLI